MICIICEKVVKLKIKGEYMKIKDFLVEFGPEDFPRETGPWISPASTDPAWLPSELRQMEVSGIIEIRHDGYYRLTMKATNYRRRHIPNYLFLDED